MSEGGSAGGGKTAGSFFNPEFRNDRSLLQNTAGKGRGSKQPILQKAHRTGSFFHSLTADARLCHTLRNSVTERRRPDHPA